MSPGRRRALMKQLAQLGLTRAKKMLKSRGKNLNTIIKDQISKEISAIDDYMQVDVNINTQQSASRNKHSSSKKEKKD